MIMEWRFNAPAINAVTIIIIGLEQYDRRDIIIQKSSKTFLRISETHRSYDALEYPLIFCEGEDDYHFNIKKTDSCQGTLPKMFLL